MAEPNGTLRVAALGDLHVTDGNRDYRDLFLEISRNADVLALCGDLTNLGTPKEAEMLAEEVRAGCRIPIVAVLGNHDYECGKAEEVEKILADAGIKLLEQHTHTINGVGFAGVKGFAGGFGDRMLGSFGEGAIKAFVDEGIKEAMRLENALHQLHGERNVAVLHYAPIPETVAGEPPELLPFLGSTRLAETIDRFKVSAVLHGHAHHGSYAGKTPRGIPVYNCAQTIEKPNGRLYALVEV